MQAYVPTSQLTDDERCDQLWEDSQEECYHAGRADAVANDKDWYYPGRNGIGFIGEVPVLSHMACFQDASALAECAMNALLRVSRISRAEPFLQQLPFSLLRTSGTRIAVAVSVSRVFQVVPMQSMMQQTLCRGTNLPTSQSFAGELPQSKPLQLAISLLRAHPVEAHMLPGI